MRQREHESRPSTWDEEVFANAARILDAAAHPNPQEIHAILHESGAAESQVQACVGALTGQFLPADSRDQWVDSLLGRGSRRSRRNILRPGFRFAGDQYEIERIIDRGSFGTIAAVSRLRPAPDEDALVAVKFISIEPTASLSSRQRFESFRREIEALLALHDQSHVVQLLDFGSIDDSLHYLCMPLMEGSLDDLVRRGVHDVRGYVALLLPVFKLLSACHALKPPLVHRDLAPRNILYVQEQGRTKLCLTDFGLGTLRHNPDFSASQAKFSRVSFRGRQFGHRLFVSPEHLDDLSQVGERSEVFGCGAVLYFCATGTAPTFRSHRRMAAPRQQFDFRFDPLSIVPEPRDVNPTVPKDLSWIITKCLQPDADQRYGSVAALTRDVESFLEGDPVYAGPLSPARKLVLFCRRFPIG